MEELEYITKNALMMCDQGGAPVFFNPTYNQKVKVHDCLVATEMDATPMSNIPSFMICKLTQKPCVPATAPMTWSGTWNVKVMGMKTLIGKSTCQCSIGGKIEFMTSGQIPLPDESKKEVEDIQKACQKELDDSGNGDSVGEAGFAEGMIPVWGSGRDLVNSVQTGDVWGGVINTGFLVWDCLSVAAGVVSFGTGTAAMQGAKAGLKGAIKGIGKQISKKAVSLLGKAAFKNLSKEALKKSIDKYAIKLLKTCVFACFPAGTKVHTEDGIRNIEHIKVGDKVWAYDESTRKLGLQPVVQTMENETDHTIKLYTEIEVIETTSLHPFMTTTGWKEASDLEVGDKLVTQQNENIAINDIKYSYKPKKVYNFEVGNWHTYLIGAWAWIVHNAGKCLSILKNTIEDVVNKSAIHIFSKDHIKNGIMLLGKNTDEIMKTISDIIKTSDAKGLLKEGPNQIRTFVKNNPVEIRVFIKDGTALSTDAFIGHSARNIGNVILLN